MAQRACFSPAVFPPSSTGSLCVCTDFDCMVGIIRMGAGGEGGAQHSRVYFHFPVVVNSPGQSVETIFLPDTPTVFCFFAIP